MKTITFPVGYRPNYLGEFLSCLEQQDLEGYTLFCSAEKSPECIKLLENSPLDLRILHKAASIGKSDHKGAIDNMFNVLNAAFTAGSDFNVHLEDDLLLAPDAINLANWYYDNYKDSPLSYTSYGMFGFQPRGEDYTALEEVPFFEGLGWCAFKENWEACYKRSWYDGTLAKKYFKAHGWDWNVQAYFKEYNSKALRPLINRTQHNGRVGGTCCTLTHHDTHYTPLKWNKAEKIKDFKIVGISDVTKEWIT